MLFFTSFLYAKKQSYISNHTKSFDALAVVCSNSIEAFFIFVIFAGVVRMRVWKALVDIFTVCSIPKMTLQVTDKMRNTL